MICFWEPTEAILPTELYHSVYENIWKYKAEDDQNFDTTYKHEDKPIQRYSILEYRLKVCC